MIERPPVHFECGMGKVKRESWSQLGGTGNDATRFIVVAFLGTFLSLAPSVSTMPYVGDDEILNGKKNTVKFCKLKIIFSMKKIYINETYNKTLPYE